MRIKCASLDSFVANLKGQHVHQGTIYVDRTQSPLNGNVHDATSWEIVMHATAVLLFPDGGEAILDYGEVLGIDRDEKCDPKEGTAAYISRRRVVDGYAEENGLTVKPGVVDM